MGFRTKLILSYAAIILLTMLMAVGLFFFIIQQIQQGEREKAEARIRDLTSTYGTAIRDSNSRVDYGTQSAIFAGLINARIILIDENNVVRVDTAGSPNALVGRSLSEYGLVPRDNKPHPVSLVLNNTNYRFYALQGPNIGPAPGVVLETDFLVGVPVEDLAFKLTDVISLTIGAVLLALLAATLVSYVVARTITRPITRITRASEAIALGDFNQRLELSGTGKDEISRLASSFNHMTTEVARSHQAMRDFVANVSHELKTPLTSIQGFSQAVMDGTADDRESIQHSVSVINEEAARMRRLVDTLLDLSRIEAGQAELRWSEIDLSALVTRVMIRLAPLANQKRVTIKADLRAYLAQTGSKELPAPTLEIPNGEGQLLAPLAVPQSPIAGPKVWGDVDRLEQVVTNILDNAIKYTPETGTVTVSLNLCNSNAPHSNNHNNTNRYYWVVLAISNNGPLIPPELHSRIFERFYKIDKSRVKKKGESTGLGLAIAKELVEAHRGMITVESGMVSVVKIQEFYPYPIETQEALTTFKIHLPLLALP